MSALEQQYVNHLRKAARSNDIYVCVLCNHKVTNTGKQAFAKHLDSDHSVDVEQSSKDPSFDLNTWREDVESRSRAAGTSMIGHDIEESSPSRGQKDNTQAMKNLALDTRKKVTPRRLAPAPADQKPPDPGGHKRSRSFDEHNHRTPNRQTKAQNPRRAMPKGEDTSTPNQLGRAGTFQSNWGTDGQPTRQLFNPADGPQPTSTSSPAPKANLPSRSTAQHADVKQQTSAKGATSSAQPTQPGQERGVLPMPTPTPSNPPRERAIAMPVDPRWPEMLLQPDSRPISQEQLAAEVKSIYAGLTMVESKCIHVDKAQALAMREGDTKILKDHWQALIALHKTLLHEHHDFFLASQHPSASPALRRLAGKYSMAARMWKHGIHSFLELLRYCLPESLEFMISFIYTAYQMMSLLYETVPAFKNTWIECLGDLGRYRMAIEDEDVRDRENWANVSRFWYTKAADNVPDTGRLYHHLAILARPNALQQLSLYARSLISVNPFASARESILTLFNPFLGRSDNTPHVSQVDSHFIKGHALLFSKEQPEEFLKCQEGYLELLDQHIVRISAKWREQGAWTMIALLGALFDYGNDSPLRRAFELGFHAIEQRVRAAATASRSPVFDPQNVQNADPDTTMEDVKEVVTVDEKTQRAWDNSLGLTVATAALVLRRQGDKNVLPFVHIFLAFLLSLTKVCAADTQVETSYVATAILQAVPRKELCGFLNTLSGFDSVDLRFESTSFIRPEKGEINPLPEDFLIRGQVWSQDYFPTDLFRSNGSDDEEKNIEHASTVRLREGRVLNIAYQLDQKKIGIKYNRTTRTFSYDESIGSGKHAATLPKPSFDPEDVKMMIPGGDFEIIDADFDFSAVSDDDAEENKQLKQAIRAEVHRMAEPGCLGLPSEGNASTEDILQSDSTYIVCDEQVMLYEQKVVQMLVQRRYTLVVPHKVLSALISQAKAGHEDSAAAQGALEQISLAKGSTDIRVIDAKGRDVTTKHLNQVPPSSCSDGAEADADDTEILLGVTRRATDLSLEARSKRAADATSSNANARPAILLTEDKSKRASAAREKVPAVAPSTIKTLFEKGLTRLRSLSQGTPARSATPWTTTPPPVLSPSGMPQSEISAQDQIMQNGP